VIPDPLVAPVLGFLGVLLGAVLTYFGVRFTASQSRKAAETAAQVSARQVDVDEWRSIVGALREEVKRLSDRVDVLEKRKESDTLLIETLKTEAEARAIRYRALVRYTLEVLAWAEDLAPGSSPPAIPATLTADLEGAPP
jgi:hypothetical protein